MTMKYFTFLILLLPLFLLATTDPYQSNNVSLAFHENEGFSVKNKFEELNIGGYIEVDGRLFFGQEQPKSTFLVRRARLFMTGELYQLFQYMFMVRWDNHESIGWKEETSIDLQYAWIDTLKPDMAQIRIGQFKKPFSLQGLKTDLFRTVLEPSLVVRNYDKLIDLGVMVYGETPHKEIAYSFGFFNGRRRHIDNNNNKEAAGRIVILLFRTNRFGRAYLGFSGTTGKWDENLSGDTFVTETFTPFWEWKGNNKNPVHVHDTRWRSEADLEFLSGPLYFCAEYQFVDWGLIRKGDRKKPFHGHGGYVLMSYLLTGEEKPRNGPVIPHHNFDPCKSRWGAWEIGAQYEYFYASKKMIDAHFAKGANELYGPIIALNWYLNPRMEMKLDAQYLWFNRKADLKSKPFDHEASLICRFQAVF
jgi:phosphate-selective porin